MIVTCNSTHSRNRRIVELVGRGEDLSKTLSQSHLIAEGVKTAHSIYNLKVKLNIKMPIFESVYNVLFNNSNLIKELH